MKKFCITLLLALAAPLGMAQSGDEEGNSDEEISFRNPSIVLAPCVLNKLHNHPPPATYRLCNHELRRLLLRVHPSCEASNLRACTSWIEREAPRLEEQCRKASHQIAEAIISCQR